MAAILILDDEESVRVSLTFALEDDYTVYTAACGPEALEILRGESIACVLLDLRLGKKMDWKY